MSWRKDEAKKIERMSNKIRKMKKRLATRADADGQDINATLTALFTAELALDRAGIAL